MTSRKNFRPSVETLNSRIVPATYFAPTYVITVPTPPIVMPSEMMIDINEQIGDSMFREQAERMQIEGLRQMFERDQAILNTSTPVEQTSLGFPATPTETSWFDQMMQNLADAMRSYSSYTTP